MNVQGKQIHATRTATTPRGLTSVIVTVGLSFYRMDAPVGVYMQNKCFHLARIWRNVPFKINFKSGKMYLYKNGCQV